MNKAVIALGGNIGDRKKNITDAIAAIDSVPMVNVKRASSVYETEPWGFKEQRSFYNSVAELETELCAEALLGACLGIEAGMGRVREFKNGPRIIDIDLLLFEGTVSDTEFLRLPHPRITERDFVLVPLYELYNNCLAPGFDFSEAYNNIIKNSTAKKVD